MFANSYVYSHPVKGNHDMLFTGLTIDCDTNRLWWVNVPTDMSVDEATSPEADPPSRSSSLQGKKRVYHLNS